MADEIEALPSTDGDEEHNYARFAVERSTGSVMDRFVAWFETEAIGEQVDEWIRSNAHRMGAHSDDMSVERNLEVGKLYNEYQERFESLLSQFLQSNDCTAEQLVAEAEDAGGMEDMYLRLFLTNADYNVFVENMTQEVQRQAAASE